MLVYNSISEKIELKPFAKELKEYKDLLSFCQEKKISIDDAIKYVYNAYSKESMYYEYLPEYKKNIVCEEILKNKYKPEDFETDVRVLRFINRFMEMEMTAVERDYERCKKDIDDLQEHISKIPFTIKKRIKREITFEYNGDVISKVIDVEIDIDNSEEKAKAIALREKIYKIAETLKNMIEKERLDKSITAKTMFE